MRIKTSSGSLQYALHKHSPDRMVHSWARRLTRMPCQWRLMWARLIEAGGESTMDTHSVACWAHRRALRRETPRRYHCQEHHLPDLIVTGTSRRPPYREPGVGGSECRPIRCCIVVSEMQASHDHTTAAPAAAAVTELGGVALPTQGCFSPYRS